MLTSHWSNTDLLLQPAPVRLHELPVCVPDVPGAATGAGVRDLPRRQQLLAPRTAVRRQARRVQQVGEPTDL